jgi:hypothetical protein
MRYNQTQIGRLHVAFFMIAAFAAAGALLSTDQRILAVILAAASAMAVLLALCFRELTVEDRGDSLSVRFGPLRLFGTRIPYKAITAVEAGRSSFTDGWGVHYVPGRGWTYNLWGFECVVVHQGKKLIRIGTEDAITLRNFLKRQMAAS